MTPHTARLLFVPTEGGFARYIGEIRQPPMSECPPAGGWRARAEPVSPCGSAESERASVDPGSIVAEMPGEEIEEDADFRRQMAAMRIDGVD